MIKRLYLSICILAFGMLSSFELAAQLSISDPVSVTQGDQSFGKRSPKLALNGNGDLIVFWMRTGTEAFFLSTLESGTFSAPVQIPFEGLNPNLWSGSLGPNMASQGGHIYVTFEIYADAIYVIHSADDGATWDAPVAAFVPPQGRRATIPTVAVDAQGHPYIAYINTDAAEEDAHYGLVRSTDFGQTFMDEVDVSANADGAEVCECCNGHLDIAPNGDVYVAFRNNDLNLRDIWLVRSTDGGATFDSAFDVDETDWIAAACPSNGPHFSIIDGELVTAFFSGTGPSGSGVYYSSFDTNSDIVSPTFDLPLSDVSSSNQNRPRVAGVGDTLAIVWQEVFDGSLDIAISASSTGFSGLSEDPMILTSLSSGQQYPSMIYADGVFHVVYEDNGSGTILYQVASIGAVGIDEDTSIRFDIRPNPSSDFIEVIRSSSTSADLVITDALGRAVKSERLVNQSSQIDISGLNQGQYTVLVIEGESRTQQKLLVVR